MAALSPSSPCCTIRIVSVHLLVAEASAQRLPPASCCGCCSLITKPPGYCEASGQISAQPHDVPRAEALILASNQQIVLAPQAAVRVL
jgi:hypothetical protein